MALMTRELERGLVEAGVSPDHAERIAVGLDERLSEVATKQDVRDVKQDVRDVKQDVRDVKQDVRDVRHDIERQIDQLERTVWRVFLGLSTIMLAMFGAVFGALMYAVFG